MFKLLSELNIDKKDYKDLALLPGFNIPNIIDKKIYNVSNVSKKLDSNNILDEKMFIKLFDNVNEYRNKSKKNKRLSNSKKGKTKKK